MNQFHSRSRAPQHAIRRMDRMKYSFMEANMAGCTPMASLYYFESKCISISSQYNSCHWFCPFIVACSYIRPVRRFAVQGLRPVPCWPPGYTQFRFM